jgi:PAS domain S-box-containing protein
LASHRRATGRDLVADDDPGRLYDLDAIVVSHRCAEDPCFVYANRAAQRLWGYAWSDFVGMPSRLSAPPEGRGVRQGLLAEGLARGAVVARDLIRITADGRRFKAREVLLWNVIDDTQRVVGQAATYADYVFIDE